MARSLTESPALLTLHSTGEGHYLVRVSDTRRRGLITTLIKALDDAQTITMVMPNDIKVFTVGGTNGNSSVVDDSVRASDDSGSASDATPLDAETMAAIAAEERTPLPNAAAEVEVEEPTPAPRARRRPKPTSVSGHPESCGRCSGSGHIKMMLDGGQAGETTCPVCRGEGQITRYGARR